MKVEGSLKGSHCFDAERVPEIPVMSSPGACRECLSSSLSILRAAVQRTRGWEEVRAHTSVNVKRSVFCVVSVNAEYLRPAEMAVKYFHLAEALYYRTLESIIEREKMILGNADLSVSVSPDRK